MKKAIKWLLVIAVITVFGANVACVAQSRANVTLNDGEVVQMSRAAKTLYQNDPAQFNTLVLEKGIYKVGPSSSFRVSEYLPDNHVIREAFSSVSNLHDEEVEEAEGAYLAFIDNAIEWIYFLEEQGQIDSGFSAPDFKEQLMEKCKENWLEMMINHSLALNLYSVLNKPVNKTERELASRGMTGVFSTGTPLDMFREKAAKNPTLWKSFSDVPYFGFKVAATQVRDLLKLQHKCFFSGYYDVEEEDMDLSPEERLKRAKGQTGQAENRMKLLQEEKAILLRNP